MTKLESILENDPHWILKDFDIQTDHLILVTREDLMLIRKKYQSEPE